MAVIDLSSHNSFPFAKTTTSVGTTQQAITLPSAARRVTVGGETAAIYLVVSGVSDGAAVPANRVAVPADQMFELNLPQGNQQRITEIAIAAQASTATITVVIEA